MSKKPRKFAIRVVAVPRSGTMHTNQILRSKGFAVMHERHDKHGIVGWQSAVKSFNVPFTTDTNEDCEYDNTWMIFRDPCKTIFSIEVVAFNYPSRNKFLEFVRRFIHLPDQDNINMAADFYVKWMNKCLSISSKVFKLNDPLLLKHLKEVIKPGQSYQKAPVGKTHTRVKEHPSKEDFLKLVPKYEEDILHLEWKLNRLAVKE